MNNYASLQEGDQEESGVLFHVAEPSRARWNHIDDLDSFFQRCYRYHQRHGYFCMMLQQVLELLQFLFVCGFTVFLFHCVDYQILFKNKPKNSNSTKTYFSDFVLPPGECVAYFDLATYFLMMAALIVWAWKLVKGVYHIVQFWDIKQFYNTALAIADSELENLTWHEVQTRIRTVQLEQQMCIHKRELTDLDIYHRILRQHNYLVAMTNKRIIPPRLQVPFVGEVVYWTKGLRYMVQLLLFWGPWSPFINPWHLKEEYRKPNARHDLAKQIKRQILWTALANLLLAPFVLIWQVLNTFFSYGELIRREPGSLGTRNWSSYSKLHLRHFNELDHELQARLSRAHRPATRYLSAFNSPILAVLARSIGFMCGSIVAVIIVLTLYDEDVLNVEHLLTIASLIGGIIVVCKGLIPDETQSYCPEALLANVLAHTHYLPNNWKGQAHTARVRAEFQQSFQYRIVALLEEILSPIITPYVLWQHLSPKSADIVDFFRNFTVSVVGVGDVCSFAQMDVRKHGNPEWHEIDHQEPPNQYTQAEDGKTELSLVHFTLTNPSWIPPPEAQHFMETVERETSLIQNVNSGENFLQADLCDSSLRSDAWKVEGPLTMNPNNMSISTMVLHDRHHRQAGRQGQRSHAMETTPLLTTLRSQ